MEDLNYAALLSPAGPLKSRRCAQCREDAYLVPVCSRCKKTLPERDRLRLVSVMEKRIATVERQKTERQSYTFWSDEKINRRCDELDQKIQRHQRLIELLTELELPDNHEALRPAVERLLEHCGRPIEEGRCRLCFKRILPYQFDEPLMAWLEEALTAAGRGHGEARFGFWNRVVVYLVASIAKKHGIAADTGARVAIRTGNIEIDGYLMNCDAREIELAETLQRVTRLEAAAIATLNEASQLRKLLTGVHEMVPVISCIVTQNGRRLRLEESPVEQAEPPDVPLA